jgi:protein SPT2
MPTFDQLMAISRTETQQSQLAVQSALAAKTARQAAEAKARAERDVRERELERKLRAKRLEEDQRAREREAKLVAERAAQERELARREQAERERLLGQKRARSAAGGGRLEYPSSSAGSSRRRGGSDDEGGAAVALTREEKRERRLQSELRGALSAAKRSSYNGGYGKGGGRLAGGAINKVLDGTTFSGQAGSTTDDANLSARARLARMDGGLVKLNQNKRDTRTIDEIQRDLDRAKGRVLEGEAAAKFAFFSDSKKEKAERDRIEKVKQAVSNAPKSSSSSPAPSSLSKFPPLFTETAAHVVHKRRTTVVRSF